MTQTIQPADIALVKMLEKRYDWNARYCAALVAWVNRDLNWHSPLYLKTWLQRAVAFDAADCPGYYSRIVRGEAYQQLTGTRV